MKPIGNRIVLGKGKPGGQRMRALVGAATVAPVALLLAVASPWPAQAQFWSPFGGGSGAPRRPPASIPQQRYNQQQQYNPFGGFFTPQPEHREAPEPEHREAPVDYSHAPAPQRKDNQAVTTPIVVMGDAMADWLAYGLEDAFSEQPEIGIVRKNRTASGLIRYDSRRDVDWAQTAREIIAADKPKVIVMMIGINDHQQIRERAPAPPAKPVAGKSGTAPAQPALGQPAEVAAAPTEDQPDAELPPLNSPDSGRSASPTGPFEFHTDQWEAAYIKRIDATIAALKSAGVPVLWVGLPAQRGPKATSDGSYLNELYRGRAEKAGIVYVDVWDSFVDEQGRYSSQGPDFEGQIRRLRSGDGVYFTKAGARKLALYAEREIDRVMANRAIPVALPSEPAQPGTHPGGPSSTRPLAGPVVPLVAAPAAGNEELLGGARAPGNPPAADPLATRVLIKGEAIGAPAGRADDFNWPRGSVTTVRGEPEAPSRPGTAAANPANAATAPAKSAKPPPAASPVAPAAPAAAAAASAQRRDPDGQSTDDSKPKPQKKPPPPHPPAPVAPLSIFPNVMFH
jgi:hypothetical protein